jgi:hypothetical protein
MMRRKRMKKERENEIFSSCKCKKKLVFVDKNPNIRNVGGPDISVVIARDYRLDGPGSIPVRDKRLFCTLHRPDRLWGPASLLSNGYREVFTRE